MPILSGAAVAISLRLRRRSAATGRYGRFRFGHHPVPEMAVSGHAGFFGEALPVCENFATMAS